MANIYDQHKAAFPLVSAFVVLSTDGDRVGSVAFKYPRDGAGRLWCYLHVFGTPMVRGYAGGGGYDKAGAACEAAAERMVAPEGPEYAADAANVAAIKAALSANEGYSWESRLRDAGFIVLQAV